MQKENSIKTLWQQIKNKTEFLIELSETNGRAVNTLRTHWFSKASNYGVPKNSLSSTVVFMESYIKNQKA
jgi:hypothetical protein